MKGVKELTRGSAEGSLHHSQMGLHNNEQQAARIETFASLISGAFSVTALGLKQPLQATAEQLPGLIDQEETKEEDTGAADIPTETSSGAEASRGTSAARVCCVAPCLKLKRNESAAFYPRSSKPLLEDAAASNMSHPMKFTVDDLQSLPMALLWNLTKSFIFLVDARLRSTVAALVRQSSADHHHADRDSVGPMLVQFLMASSTNHSISPTAVVTTFRTLAFAERTQEGDCVLPLVVEAVVDMDVFGTCINLSVEAPGTIQASFSRDKIRHVEIVMDTSALLNSMMTQARTCVKRAIAIATELVTRELTLSQSVRRTMSASHLGLLHHSHHQHAGSRSSSGSLASLGGLSDHISSASSLPSLLHLAAERLQQQEDSQRNLMAAVAAQAAARQGSSSSSFSSLAGGGGGGGGSSSHENGKSRLIDSLMPPPPARAPSLPSIRASRSSSGSNQSNQLFNSAPNAEWTTTSGSSPFHDRHSHHHHPAAPAHSDGTVGLSLLTDVVSRLKRESHTASAILHQTTTTTMSGGKEEHGSSPKKPKTEATALPTKKSSSPDDQKKQAMQHESDKDKKVTKPSLHDTEQV